jgi:hypothetical protein
MSFRLTSCLVSEETYFFVIVVKVVQEDYMYLEDREVRCFESV